MILCLFPDDQWHGISGADRKPTALTPNPDWVLDNRR